MSLIDDVRRALQPLIDKGIVLDVQESLSGARYDTQVGNRDWSEQDFALEQPTSARLDRLKAALLK